MNAQLHLGHQRAADLRAEAARDRLARQAQPRRQERPAPRLNLRALLIRLRLA